MQLIADGREYLVEDKVKMRPKELLAKVDVTCFSGQCFENIFPLQLAVWAHDVRYMAPKILHSLPKNEEGDEIRRELLRQVEHALENGVTYKLNGQLITEKHYDFALIDALKDYIDNYDNRTPDVRLKCWITKVGGAQRLIPVHVAQHYCDTNESFDSIPSFKKEEFRRVLRIFSWVTQLIENWFPLSESSGLGFDFAILRGERHTACAANFPPSKAEATMDWTAMTELRKVRGTEDLESFMTQLKTPLLGIESEEYQQGLFCTLL